MYHTDTTPKYNGLSDTSSLSSSHTCTEKCNFSDVSIIKSIQQKDKFNTPHIICTLTDFYLRYVLIQYLIFAEI